MFLSALPFYSREAVPKRTESCLVCLVRSHPRARSDSQTLEGPWVKPPTSPYLNLHLSLTSYIIVLDFMLVRKREEVPCYEWCVS